MRFCTNCGAQLNDTAQFCTNCGAKLTKTEQKKAKQKVLKFFVSGVNKPFGPVIASLVTGERNLTIGEMVSIYPENMDIQLTEFKVAPCKLEKGKSPSLNVMIGKKQIGYVRDNQGEETNMMLRELINANRVESITAAISGGKAAKWSQSTDQSLTVEMIEKPYSVRVAVIYR